MNPYLSIIIPAYNEENKIKDTLENIKDIEEISEIIVVDDGSSDNTSKVAKEVKSPKITVITQDKNRGKGYALNNGLKIAMEKADIIGFLDADLGSSSKEVSKLITPILNNEADVIIAKFPPAKKKGGLGFVKGLAKSSVLEMTGVELDATLSGQRIFKKEVGITPYRYILNCKIEAVKEDLHAGVDVNTIVNKYEFYDLSHLNKNFIKVYAITPLEYQESCKKSSGEL